MSNYLTIDESATACGVHRDTIKRRLRHGEFPGAIRGEANGNREPPWLIPLGDLLRAGLRPAAGGELDVVAADDPEALRRALTHQVALNTAREEHLVDLRTELRRMHARLEEATRLLEAGLSPR